LATTTTAQKKEGPRGDITYKQQPLRALLLSCNLSLLLSCNIPNSACWSSTIVIFCVAPSAIMIFCMVSTDLGSSKYRHALFQSVCQNWIQ
jgi:hypothetical protein